MSKKNGNANNEIEYDAALKEMVLTKLEEMRQILKRGQAHRNHNKPGKCRSCSRRVLCPERLG